MKQTKNHASCSGSFRSRSTPTTLRSRTTPCTSHHSQSPRLHGHHGGCQPALLLVSIHLMSSGIPVVAPSAGTPISKHTDPRPKPANPSILNIPGPVTHATSAKNVTVFYAVSKRSGPIGGGSGNADAVANWSTYININVSCKSKRPPPRYNWNKDINEQMVGLLQVDCRPS